MSRDVSRRSREGQGEGGQAGRQGGGANLWGFSCGAPTPAPSQPLLSHLTLQHCFAIHFPSGPPSACLLSSAVPDRLSRRHGCGNERTMSVSSILGCPRDMNCCMPLSYSPMPFPLCDAPDQVWRPNYAPSLDLRHDAELRHSARLWIEWSGSKGPRSAAFFGHHAIPRPK